MLPADRSRRSPRGAVDLRARRRRRRGSRESGGDGGGIDLGREVAGDDDHAAGRGPSGAQGGEAIVDGDLRECGSVELARGGGVLEDVLWRMVWRGRRSAASGGWGLLDGVVEDGAHVGGGLAQLGGLEAVLKGAAELLLGHGEGGTPLLGLGRGDLERAVREEVEHLVVLLRRR
jgi:hypothetical protein